MNSKHRNSVPLPVEEVSSPAKTRLVPIMVALCLAVFLTGMVGPNHPSDRHARHQQRLPHARGLRLVVQCLPPHAEQLQLFYGKLYSLFPIKVIYFVAIALFELGSLVCTVAPNPVALIIGRAIAGLGAAGIFSGGILITTKIIPLAERASYLSVMSAAFGLAAIVGPFLGGALVERSTWRWCFEINLPLGVVTVDLRAPSVRTPLEPGVEGLSLIEKFMQLDIPGTVCMVASLICLLIALQWGGSTYPWNDGRVIALFVVSGVLAIAFFVIQKTSFAGKGRTIPSSLIRSRDIWLAASYAMCITGGVYVAVLYLPVWFQIVRGFSALSSGSMLTPLIAEYVVSSVIAGGVMAAIGYYNPGMIAGTALSIAGAVGGQVKNEEWWCGSRAR